MIGHKRETCYHCPTITPGERAFKDPGSYCPACAARCRIPRKEAPPAYNQRMVSAASVNFIAWREKGRAVDTRIDVQAALRRLRARKEVTERAALVFLCVMQESDSQGQTDWFGIARKLDISEETAQDAYFDVLRKLDDVLRK